MEVKPPSTPAVTVGVAVAGRFEWKDVPAYVVAQVLGGLLGGTAIWGIARGQSGWDRIGNMAANGYGANSPGGYGLVAVLVAEVLLTAVFLYIILGCFRQTRGRIASGDFAMTSFKNWPISNPGSSDFRVDVS